MPGHEISVRVYYEDTDAGGIVFYPNYLKFAERGRTEYLRSVGFANSQLAKEEGMIFVVRKLDADYLAPARLDDMLTIRTSVTTINNASFVMRQEFDCKGQLIFTMNVTLVCVTTSDGKPMRMPQVLRNVLEQVG